MSWLAGLVAAALLILGIPIFLVFGASGGMVAIVGLDLPWTTLLQTAIGAVTKNVLLAIPLFILAGLIMVHGGIATRLVDFCIALVGHWRGGLALAMVLAMGFFGAFCGSILAAITAVGAVLIPRMLAYGYPAPFVIVLAATAGLLEALIPPSNAAIIFSALTQTPVSKTFAAGIAPGIVLMLLLMAFVVWRCRDMPTSDKATWRQRRSAFLAAAPALITPVLILGGIYLGFFTPSESAAVAALWATLVGFLIYRELTFAKLAKALKATALATTAIFSIIAMATFLSVALTYTRVPQHIAEFFVGFGTTRILFLFMVGIVCLILGTFLEVIPIIYITIPVFLGLAAALKIDMTHFYVVFTGFVGMGLLTPPVCVGIYSAAAVARTSPEKAFREVPAFLAVTLVYAVIMVLVPAFSTYLASLA